MKDIFRRWRWRCMKRTNSTQNRQTSTGITMTESSSLQVNDPVYIHQTGTDGTSTQLEGIICYIGQVPELSLDDQNNYIGIRLTGSSIGHGNNDGTIQQQRYFDCPMNCGIFIQNNNNTTTSNITKRTLTKLEALRLRRELASTTSTTGAAISAPSATTTNVTPATPARESLPPGMTTQQPPTVGASSSTSAMSRLEELRIRREALKASKQQQQVDTPVVTTTTAPTISPTKITSQTSSSIQSPVPQTVDENASDKIRIDELLQQLAMKEKENKELIQDITKYKQENQTYQTKLIELQNNFDKVQSQQLVSTKPTTTTSNDTKVIDELHEQNLQLQSSYTEVKEQLTELQHELLVCQNELKDKITSNETTLVELTRARAEATSYQNQLRAQSDQNDQRGMSDAVHYKERAKLSADISALKRKIEQLEREKMELEAAVEDITLDKEQLQEEKDTIQEQYEELKLDAETAQMEVEELRIELEDAKATASRFMGVSDTLTVAAMASAGSPSKVTVSTDQDIETIQSLQTQNTRLRDALIRLREQSSLEKMDLTRQLRSLEKVVESNTAVQSRIDELTTQNQTLIEQNNDLKDMIEQGSAYEGMVEDLSDRLIMLEEQNMSLQTIIREMEDAADITAEMEEVQSDEIKALARELEGRDTIIRNLEEAIKMQRRREDDFIRTVGNYKRTVDTLRREKQVLLELQQGGEGEKHNLVASSQKALSRAAQLVSETVNIRKREALAVVDHMNRIMYQHMSHRFETLLPQSVVSVEVTTIKGEITASKVCCSASYLLSGIKDVFQKSIRPPLPDTNVAAKETALEESKIVISDDVQQEVLTIFHQVDFAYTIIEASAEIIRLIAAGQWPDLLSTEDSTELGTIMGHSVLELDETFFALLKTLKQEGSLTIEQSNAVALKLTAQSTVQALRGDIENDDRILVKPDWNPPGWAVLRDIATAKFACLGTAAALSRVVNFNVTPRTSQSAMDRLYVVVEQISSLASNATRLLYNLDILDTKQIDMLSNLCTDFLSESMSLMSSTREMLKNTNSGDLVPSEVSSGNALRLISKISLELRSKNMTISDSEMYHPLSPEADDTWGGITSLIRSIRSIDGDSDDINYLLRSKAIEQRLGDAIDNEPKLEWSTSKISTLEKALSSRTKELAMQNARLSELEKLMAKSTVSPLGRGPNFDFRSSEEYNNLQEENRVLTEAMEVLQREVEKYENEIRMLKDFKSPKRGNVSSSRTTGTPGKSSTPMVGGLISNVRGPGDDHHSSISLEATFFRPALQQALYEASHWKAAATAAALLDLPPLPTSPFELYSGESNLLSEKSILLSSALAKSRIEKASISLVDLRNEEKAPRAQLREMKAKSAAIAERLESALLRCNARN